jgi:hypothetical protein
MFVKTDFNNNIVTYPYNLDRFVEDNKNTSLPKYLNNRFLATRNVYPVYSTNIPEHDNITQFAIAANTPYNTEETSWLLDWIIVDKSPERIQQEFEEYKIKFRKEINQARDTAIFQVLYVKVNETTIVPVDLRIDTADMQNIVNVTQIATIQHMLSETSLIDFRGYDNVIYKLTPAEAIELGKTVAQTKSAAYAKSWEYKDYLSTTTTITEINNIQLIF